MCVFPHTYTTQRHYTYTPLIFGGKGWASLFKQESFPFPSLQQEWGGGDIWGAHQACCSDGSFHWRGTGLPSRNRKRPGTGRRFCSGAAPCRLQAECSFSGAWPLCCWLEQQGTSLVHRNQRGQLSGSGQPIGWGGKERNKQHSKQGGSRFVFIWLI